MKKIIAKDIERKTEILKPTGEREVLHIEKESIAQTIHNQEPPFIKLYIQDLLYLSDMPKGLTNVTYALASRSTYANPRNNEEGLMIILNPYIKEQICKECNYKNVRSLNNDITKLVKGNIIKRLGTSTFQLNPYIFGKGEWKDIDNIRMTWGYNDVAGRTFAETLIEYKARVNGGEEQKAVNE